MYVIKENSLVEVYPYIYIALRMLLFTPSSNCLTEKSFSKLKRVNTYLRSTTGESRLNSLAILNIKADLTKTINFNIIETFASQKSRKKL
jgi:DNA (cytosine-5)-methyltransferase 1